MRSDGNAIGIIRTRRCCGHGMDDTQFSTIVLDKDIILSSSVQCLV